MEGISADDALSYALAYVKRYQRDVYLATLSGQMVIIPCQNIDSYDDGYCSPSFTVVGSPANEYRRSCLYCPPGHTRNGLPRQTIAGYACYY